MNLLKALQSQGLGADCVQSSVLVSEQRCEVQAWHHDTTTKQFIKAASWLLAAAADSACNLNLSMAQH